MKSLERLPWTVDLRAPVVTALAGLILRPLHLLTVPLATASWRHVCASTSWYGQAFLSLPPRALSEG